MKKKLNIIVLTIFISLILLIGCKDNINSNKNEINIDDVLEKIAITEFKNFTLNETLDYEKINKTKIFIENKFIGDREYLVDEEGNSSQRLLFFKSKDGTNISVMLGKLKEKENIRNDTLIVFADGLKNIGLKNQEDGKNAPINVDNTIYSFNNLIISVLSLNTESGLNIEEVIDFKEQLIQSLNTITKETE